MSKIDQLAGAFARTIRTRSDINYGGERVGLFILGASAVAGKYPIPLTVADIMNGFERDGIKVSGTGANRRTIDAGIKNLTDAGLLQVRPHSTTQGGGARNLYFLKV
jgi:hypothetical protein